MTQTVKTWLPIVALVIGAVALHALLESYLSADRSSNGSAASDALLQRVMDLEQRQVHGSGDEVLMKQIRELQHELEMERKKKQHDVSSSSHDGTRGHGDGSGVGSGEAEGNGHNGEEAGENRQGEENNLSLSKEDLLKRIAILEEELQNRDKQIATTPAGGTGGEHASTNTGGGRCGKSGAGPEVPPRLVLVIDAIAESLDDNTKYFLRHGVFNDGTADFLFVSNGFEISLPMLYAEIGEELPNIAVINRDNRGFDFCAWKEAMETEGKKKPYTHFILLNRTVRGPFLPSYYKDTWITAVLSLMSDRVGAVGLSINCRAPERPANPDLSWPVNVFPEFHLQSMFLALDTRARDAFLKHAGCYDDKTDVIFKNEVKSTYWFVEGGFTIASLMQLWKDVAIDDTQKTRNRCGRCGGDPFWSDPQIEGRLFVHPLETVFVKTSRIETGEIHYFSEWADDVWRTRQELKRQG